MPAWAVCICVVSMGKFDFPALHDQHVQTAALTSCCQHHVCKLVTAVLCVSQDKVVKSMPKLVDPQDPELRQLPVQGLTGSAIRDKLNYKVNILLQLLLLLPPLMSVDILTAIG